MAAYADLDTSVIDELPPGRQPVSTIAVPDTRRGEIVERVRAACTSGQQAYWVCPLIEESEVLDYQAAEASYQVLTEALARAARGPRAWAHAAGRERARHAGFQGRADPGARCDHGDRGGRGRAECEPDDYRERRAHGSVATAPAAWSGRPGRGTKSLRIAVQAAARAHRQGTACRTARHQRRLRRCTARSRTQGSRRTARHTPDRPARLPSREPRARCRADAAGTNHRRSHPQVIVPSGLRPSCDAGWAMPDATAKCRIAQHEDARSSPDFAPEIASQLRNYGKLMRVDKPIGIWLLLWPTLWALWLAGEGTPDQGLFVVFVLAYSSCALPAAS